jgi:hypothetical protein
MPNNGFEGDSDVADRVEPSLGFRRKKYDERPGDVVAIVVHTTGGGPVKRFKNAAERKKFKYKTPFDAALRIYRELMFEGPHYLVGQGDGEIAQLAPETLSAWHVGQAGGHLYDLDQWSTPDVRWWKDRWGTLESPRGLANGRLWSHDSVNANTIGIEVVPHEARSGAGATRRGRTSSRSCRTSRIDTACRSIARTSSRTRTRTRSGGARRTSRGIPARRSGRGTSSARAREARTRLAREMS